MSEHRGGYHLGYETAKAYQAEMRGVAAVDRHARQVRSTADVGTSSRLVALLRDARICLPVSWLGRHLANAAAPAPKPALRDEP